MSDVINIEAKSENKKKIFENESKWATFYVVRAVIQSVDNT